MNNRYDNEVITTKISRNEATVVIEGKEIIYHPATPPVPDDCTLAEMGSRVIIYHHRSGLRIRLAPKSIIHAGWVIGFVVD